MGAQNELLTTPGANQRAGKRHVRFWGVLTGGVTQVRSHHSLATRHFAAFLILADTVDVKKGDHLSETVSQQSIWTDKVDPPTGS